MDIHPENGFTYLDNTMNKRQEIKLSGEILDVFEDAGGNLYWYGVKEEGGAIHSFKNDEALVDGFADINRYEYKAGFRRRADCIWRIPEISGWLARRRSPYLIL